jgi:replicative DNA helicase
MLKREKVDLSEERRILSYMITSTAFLSKLQAVAQPKLFQSSYSRTVAQWIWEYYEHTSEAPGRMIEEVFLKKKKEVRDEEDQELIAEFLQRLSKDWEKSQVKNVPYTVKNATEFFKVRSLERLKDRLGEAIALDDHALGERLVGEYKRVGRPLSTGVDLLKDSTPVILAFSREHEMLFSYPGQLGDCVGIFERGDFLAIMGAMKKGKTHYLWYTAYKAALSGFKTVFVSLEMSEHQMLRRMWVTLEGRPLKSGYVKLPRFEASTNDSWEIKFKKKMVKGIDPSEVPDRQNFYRRNLRTSDIRLLTYPSYGASVKDIETDLANLEYYEGFVPDVLIVEGRMDYRHQLDVTWKTLRGMAQERSMMVVTGTQTGRSALDRDVRATDTAEDIRKLAHVTKMISLNQTKQEKEDGIMRIETVVQREGRQYHGQVVVLQCYDIGRAYLDSRIKDQVNMKKYEPDKAE